MKDVMKVMDKIKFSRISIGLYVFAGFSLINLLIHLIGFYLFPLFSQFDYLLYIAKILIDIALYNTFKESKAFLKETKWLRVILYLDIIELFISFFSPGMNNVGVLYIGILIILKFALEYRIFGLLIKDGTGYAYDRINTRLSDKIQKYNRKWIVINGLIVVAFISEFPIRKTLLVAVICILFTAKIIFEIFISIYLFNKCFNYQGPVFDRKNIPTIELLRFYELDKIDAEIHEESKTKPKKNIKFPNLHIHIDKRITYCACLLIALLFAFMRFTYIEGDMDILDENENVVSERKTVSEVWFRNYYDYPYGNVDEEIVQYNVCNRMPSWSCFYKEKYGLINLKTGVDTGAIYDEPLAFDSEGIAYDYNGHFVNTSGEKIKKVPYIVNAKTSERQYLLYLLLDKSNSNDKNRHHFIFMPSTNEIGGFLLSGDYTYFANGVACYHSDLNDKYGFISDDDDILTLPVFSYVSGKQNFKISLVINYNNTELDLIDSKGQSLAGGNITEVLFCDDEELVSFRYKNIYESDSLMTYDGKIFDDSYFYRKVEGTGDLEVFYKTNKEDDSDSSLICFYRDNTPILTLDSYYDCYACADENNIIEFVVLEKDDKYSIIDLDGNVVTDYDYEDIIRTADPYTFIGIRNENQFDLIHLKGSTETYDYSYVEINKDKTEVFIKKSDGSELTNYMDLDGNILELWMKRNDD